MNVVLVLLVLVPLLALGAALMDLLLDAAPRRGRWPMSDPRFQAVVLGRGKPSVRCALCGCPVEDPGRVFQLALPRGASPGEITITRPTRVCQRCFDRGVEPG